MGRIKEGQGTIIGNAGEYLVVGELLRREVIAAPAPRNNPGFDVLATTGTVSVNIRVKTKTQAANSWVWNCKKDGTIFGKLSNKSDFTILVDLKDTKTSPEYYILPTTELDRKLRDIFDYWLHSPAKRGKPHASDNRMRRIGESTHQQEWLSQWKGKWSLILNALGAGTKGSTVR